MRGAPSVQPAQKRGAKLSRQIPHDAVVLNQAPAARRACIPGGGYRLPALNACSSTAPGGEEGGRSVTWPRSTPFRENGARAVGTDSPWTLIRRLPTASLALHPRPHAIRVVSHDERHNAAAPGHELARRD